MECTTTGQRICSRCGYIIKDEELLRCPRCNELLLMKCSECKKCKSFNFLHKE